MKKEELSIDLVRNVVTSSIEFYERERELGERRGEIFFCNGAIIALKVFMSMLEKGFEDETQ